ncbi:MAG: glucosidase [Syntrophobacteraceae bacterium]
MERLNPVEVRLAEDFRREKNWKRWGPYLSERQWGTVREDYSADGDAWEYFPHDHARSRAYRWGEDGLLGITDREGRLCLAVALWNGRDPILKERFFGVTNQEGNHGEDVKEYYFYLDSTPIHSYCKALYKYPQNEFPYAQLVAENRKAGRDVPEFELMDTGIFEDNRYFDVFAEYCKESPDDILMRFTAANRSQETATLHILPTLWFRNTWSWGRTGEAYWPKPSIYEVGPDMLLSEHATLGRFCLAASPGPDGKLPRFLFTENETNLKRLYGVGNPGPYVKDAFHDFVVNGRAEAVNQAKTGTKAAAYYILEVPAYSEQVINLRLFEESRSPKKIFGDKFDRTFRKRIEEADEFYHSIDPKDLEEEERKILRQAYSGLLWSKQFYHYSVKDWIDGDPVEPVTPENRKPGRNSEWIHLYNRDVISMPDKWEYPWYAIWDSAFQMLPFAELDRYFAKDQLVLFLREWYMHPNGQLPAYEWDFNDVNPPVFAWAAWRVYKITAPRGERDRYFLARVFNKLLLNFTWWVNRKDLHGKNLFTGGFLGLDNIGVFDRSRPLPTGGHLEQADATAWMAFYCATMLSMALELAEWDPAYEDMASKFFEHFIAIADSINNFLGTGLWDDQDGFYYDHLHHDGEFIPLRIRSMVGLIPLVAVEVIEDRVVQKLPGFLKRMNWFLGNRKDLAGISACMARQEAELGHRYRLISIPSRQRLVRSLRYLLDENEFLSPHGIRSLSKVHEKNPFEFGSRGASMEVGYVPGESNSNLFGGNSNWRGPIWFPINYLIIEALERYHHFYGDSLRVEFPTGSGELMNLDEVAKELTRRLVSIFLPGKEGRRPWHGDLRKFAEDPYWRDLMLFNEYFHGDTGRGLGANHQTGWTALITRNIKDLAGRARKSP